MLIYSIKLTVKDAAMQWLSSAKLRVKPSSYANYENIIRSHILPILGAEFLVDITSQQLNDFIYSKMQSGSLHGAAFGIVANLPLSNYTGFCRAEQG